MGTSGAAVSQHVMDGLLNQQKNDEEKIKRFEKRITELSQENERLKKRSNEITSEMASALDRKGELENVGDAFSNMKIATKFHDLYDSKWPSVIEWLQTTVKMIESKAISHLSELMKKHYENCVTKADQQIRQFLKFPDDAKLPNESEEPELYRMRRLRGQATDFIAKILEEEFPPSSGEACKEPNPDKLDDFLKRYTECCWLMTISNPQLALNFDIIGKKHSGKLSSCYGKYTSQDPVVDKADVGTIIEVVWPAVKSKDGTSIYKKGTVITVDEVEK